ncbi:MAG: serine hydrolase domain-containing protein [Pseudomonadota bacterium]
MIRFFNLAFLALTLLIPAAASAKPLNTDAVDALVRAYGAPDQPGISVAIAHDEEVIYEGWTGLADLERSVAINRDTRFHIASISKQFTAFAILKLAEEGKLRVNQPISDFFPEVAAGRGAVTIQHLLDHTGGLREINTLTQMLGLSESSSLTGDQLLAIILRQKGINFEAGSDEEYSNTGYQLLAHIVAQVSDQSFADYMQTEIFSPLGMRQSVVRTDPMGLIENVAVSYEMNGQSFIHAPIFATAFGSTGIVSNPRNLLRWGQSLNAAELAGEPIVTALAKRSRLPDGRKVVAGNGQEFRNFRGLKTWSHGGSTGGFRSFLLRIPDQKLTIAVMGNRADFLKATFAFDVAEALLKDTLDAAPEPDLTPETAEELDSYAGDYRLFPGTVFSLRRDGDALNFAGYGESPGFALSRLSKGVFLLNPVRDIRLEFHDFADGKATQMRWQVSEDGYLIAPRVMLDPVPQGAVNLSAHTGTFYSDELQIGVTISEKEDTLWLASNIQAPVPLVQYAGGVFRPDGPAPFPRIEFVMNKEGRAQKLLMGAPLAQNLEFNRRD